MDENHVIEPFGISASLGRLHIDGYPTAKRICKITSGLAQRLAGLRLHEADLEFCAEMMQQLVKLGEPNEGEMIKNVKQREALLIPVIVKFCGCFGDNKSRFPLSAEKIYKHTPHAMEAFKLTKDLRDKHLVHDDNNCHFSVTCAVLGDNDQLIDIVNLKSQFFPTFDFYKNLFNLIADAQKYVVFEIEQVRQRLFDEINALEPAERAKYPDVQHTFPTAADISKTRSY